MKQIVNSRSEYNRLVMAYKKLNKANVRFTQSTLVLTAALDGVKSSFLFPVLENDPDKFLIEKRLNINDEFIVNSIGIYLLGNVTNNAVVAKQEFYRYFTTPLVELAPTFAVHQNLYNGQLSIAVNNIKFLEKWDTRKHQYTGVTQSQNATAGQPFATFPSAEMQSAGMVACTPNVTLSGAKKNAIQLDLPNATPLPIVSTTLAVGPALALVGISIERIAFVAEGWLAQNAAVFQK